MPRPRSRSTCSRIIRAATGSRICRPATIGCRSGRRAIRPTGQCGMALTADQNAHAGLRAAEGELRALDRHFALPGPSSSCRRSAARTCSSSTASPATASRPAWRRSKRNEDGWRARVNYMREAMALLHRAAAVELHRQKAEDIVHYHQPGVRRGVGAAALAGRSAGNTRTRCAISPMRRSRSSTSNTRRRAPTACPGARIPTRTAASGFPITGAPTRSRGSIPRPAR